MIIDDLVQQRLIEKNHEIFARISKFLSDNNGIIPEEKTLYYPFEPSIKQYVRTKKINGKLIHCVDVCTCTYLENEGMFQALHSEYKKLKIELSIVRKKLRNHYDYDSWLGSRELRLTAKTEQLRTKLSCIWPCSVCVDLYNPTGRIRNAS